MLGYGTGAAMVARDVDGYLKKTGSAVPLRVAIRPMFPDCESTATLAHKCRRRASTPSLTLLGRPEVTDTPRLGRRRLRHISQLWLPSVSSCVVRSGSV